MHLVRAGVGGHTVGRERAQVGGGLAGMRRLRHDATELL